MRYFTDFDQEAQDTMAKAAKLTREIGIKIDNPRNDLDDLEHLACALEHISETIRSIISEEQ